MNKVELVKEAVELAKMRGVLFVDGSPVFRPESKPERFHVVIQANTPLSSGSAVLDRHFNVLDGFTQIKLANLFIRIFNELNVGEKLEKIKKP